MNDSNITKCYSSNGNGGCIYTTSILMIKNCIFNECYVNGETKKGGAIYSSLEKSIGMSKFKLANITFINCRSSDGEYGHSVYINVISDSNEDFLFDTITLQYTTPITEPILLMDIYNLDGIVNINSNIETKTERYENFKAKFIGFCPSSPLNTTSFIVYDVENKTSQQSYPLPMLICDRESLILYFFIFKNDI
jgi:hypothetical protein